MTAKEINKKIQEMISSDSVPQDEIIRFVKGECQTVALTPQTLGMLFEMYADVKYDAHDPTSCFSREIPISELKNLHPGSVFCSSGWTECKFCKKASRYTTGYKDGNIKAALCSARCWVKYRSRP